MKHRSELDASHASSPSAPRADPLSGAPVSARLCTYQVKIFITDCDGALVTILAPVVQLDRIDTTPAGPVNEPMVIESATNGKTMRWVGEVYHYKLSTKNSQFNGGSALTVGTYRITVTDPSLAESASVSFDLR